MPIRSRTTRNRVRILRAVLAVTLVAGTAAVLSPGSTSAATAGPTDVLVSAGQLPRGANTPLAHVQQEVIVDGSVRIPIDWPAPVWFLGHIGNDYLVTGANSDFTQYAVLLVTRSGHQRVVRRFGDNTTVTASADGTHLALATFAHRDTVVRAVDTRTGVLVGKRTFDAYGAEVSDYGTQRMVITGIRGGKTFWWDPLSNQLSLLVPHPAGAHIAADRLVVMVPNPTTPYLDCQETVRLSRPSKVLWRSCSQIPLAFSPDAQHMLTVDIQSDGIGPQEVQVRTRSGALERAFQAPWWFGFTVWESDDAVLLQPVDRHYLAAVRCDLDGRCERASKLYASPGTFDPPTTMRWSFAS